MSVCLSVWTIVWQTCFQPHYEPHRYHGRSSWGLGPGYWQIFKAWPGNEHLPSPTPPWRPTWFQDASHNVHFWDDCARGKGHQKHRSGCQLSAGAIRGHLGASARLATYLKFHGRISNAPFGHSGYQIPDRENQSERLANPPTRSDPTYRPRVSGGQGGRRSTLDTWR